MLEIRVHLKCSFNFLENKKLIEIGAIDSFLRGRMFAGLGLGLDYCRSRSRTKGIGRQPVLVSVLVSKKLSGLGLGLEAGGLDHNTVTTVIKMCTARATHMRSVHSSGSI